MINIIGILIIVSGFVLPYFIATRVSATYFFWVGGLLSFRKGIIIRAESLWPKWIQIGILIHIASICALLIAHLLIGYGSITSFEYWFSQLLYWLSNPGTAIGQQLFPYPETHSPNGSVCFQISYTRTVITAFLDVTIFALLSIPIGMFWHRKKQI